MNTTGPLRRLADARPEAAGLTTQLVGADEREALLQSILASEGVPTLAPSPARPRRRRLRLVTALAAPALAGLVVLALVWAGTGPVDRPSPPEVPDAAAPTEPVTLDRVRLAVAEADDLILHMKSDHGNGVLWEMWHDTVEGRSRSTSTTPSGRPLYDHEMQAVDGGRTTVKVVSYDDRAWWTYVTPPERGGATMTHGLSAADIRSQLADGTLEEVGPTTLEGRAVLHLRWMPHSKPGLVTRPGDMWVDATTYLPVRSVNHWGVKGDQSTRSDYGWLPRSAGNVANLAAPVPAGFGQRAGAPEDRPGAEDVG